MTEGQLAGLMILIIASTLYVVWTMNDCRREIVKAIEDKR